MLLKGQLRQEKGIRYLAVLLKLSFYMKLANFYFPPITHNYLNYIFNVLFRRSEIDDTGTQTISAINNRIRQKNFPIVLQVIKQKLVQLI